MGNFCRNKFNGYKSNLPKYDTWVGSIGHFRIKHAWARKPVSFSISIIYELLFLLPHLQESPMAYGAGGYCLHMCTTTHSEGGQHPYSPVQTCQTGVQVQCNSATHTTDSYLVNIILWGTPPLINPSNQAPGLPDVVVTRQFHSNWKPPSQIESNFSGWVPGNIVSRYFLASIQPNTK